MSATTPESSPFRRCRVELTSDQAHTLGLALLAAADLARILGVV